MTLVYLDTETTGLDWMRHDVVEIAWAVEDGPIHTMRTWHTLENADPQALEVNRYYERGLDDRWGPESNRTDLLRDFMRDLQGATIVGSNPAFDTAMLRRKFGVMSWHHRLWDVSAYASGVFGWDRLHGLADISAALRDLSFEIGEPDHTARQDVLVLRQVHQALLQVAGVMAVTS